MKATLQLMTQHIYNCGHYLLNFSLSLISLVHLYCVPLNLTEITCFGGLNYIHRTIHILSTLSWYLDFNFELHGLTDKLILINSIYTYYLPNKPVKRHRLIFFHIHSGFFIVQACKIFCFAFFTLILYYNCKLITFLPRPPKAYSYSSLPLCKFIFYLF